MPYSPPSIDLPYYEIDVTFQDNSTAGPFAPNSISLTVENNASGVSSGGPTVEISG